MFKASKSIVNRSHQILFAVTRASNRKLLSFRKRYFSLWRCSHTAINFRPHTGPVCMLIVKIRSVFLKCIFPKVEGILHCRQKWSSDFSIFMLRRPNIMRKCVRRDRQSLGPSTRSFADSISRWDIARWSMWNSTLIYMYLIILSTYNIWNSKIVGR